MRYLLIPFLVFTAILVNAQGYCLQFSNVDVANVRAFYTASTGTAIEGTFTNLSPTRFRVQYKNLTDNFTRWRTETNYTVPTNNGRQWYIHSLEPSKEYKVRIFAPYQGGRWCEIAMHHIWTHLNTADFRLNGQRDGTVTVCGNDLITMDAALSRHETHYGIAIREIDSQGRGIGREMLKEYTGQAPNGINLRSVAASQNFPLDGGKRYYVKLFTRPSWQEKIILLEVSPAKLDVRPLADQVSGNAREYTSCVFQGLPQLTVDASASSCETGYLLNIVEIANGQNLETTRFNQWITPLTALPDRLDVASIYRNAGHSFQVGKRYQVTVAVGSPWAADHFYLKFLSASECSALPDKPTRVLRRDFDINQAGGGLFQ